MIGLVALAILGQIAIPPQSSVTGVTTNTTQTITGAKTFSAATVFSSTVSTGALTATTVTMSGALSGVTTGAFSGTITSSVGSGSNAFAVTTQGAHVGIGPGANNYFYESGTGKLATPGAMDIGSIIIQGASEFGGGSLFDSDVEIDGALTFGGPTDLDLLNGSVFANQITAGGGIDLSGTGNLSNGVNAGFSGILNMSTVSGSDAIVFATQGARLHLGTGANSYLKENASNEIESATTLKATALTSTGGLAAGGAITGATTIAMSGALSGATTGAFSGQVNVGSLVSAGAVSSTSHAMTGALTGATTGSFSGNLAAGSLTSSGGLAAGGAITGATTIATSGAITSSVGSGSNAVAISTQGARVGVGPAANSYFFENSLGRIETPNHLIINNGAINLFSTGLLQVSGFNLAQTGGYAQLTTQSSNAPMLLIGTPTDNSTALAGAVKPSAALTAEGGMLWAGFNSGTTQEFSLDWRGMLLLNKQNRTEPTCDSNTYHRGLISYSPGASLTADRLRICMKNSADAYSWQTVFTGL